MSDITSEIAPSESALPTAAPPATEAPPAPEAVPAPETAPLAETAALAETALLTEPPAAPLPEVVVPRAPRRGLRAAIRWTAAVLVFAALGGATAYAVTRPERTRIPGLHTPDDGRWTYPPLALPELPAGKPRPFADANPGHHHYTDVRSLLLPAPVGGTADPAVPGPAGWLPQDSYLGLFKAYDDYLRKTEGAELREQGLRHIAARSFTTPDGTRTDIYLLQFLSGGFADIYAPNLGAQRLKVAPDAATDKSVASPAVPADVTVDASAESPPYGESATRYAFLRAGDVIALVVQTRKGSVAEVPFRQTVRLQAQLLG
ncbi:hypothetical protein SAMN05216267_1024102 [Actinacidiphila rubida]|uniref:Uncharacterized protein n=1 Tax=Actinacidiphila rubida TaxID=310780 RepID=A0A1H8P4V4_9ACTN|nr:hypothetical protein [Actinacidiphila rubida]SEO36688.1 hypothetical protein SAMN05216267_1024102 [Actinacidiphila rubida]